MSRAGISIFLLYASLLVQPVGAAQAQTATPEDVARRIGLSDAAIERVKRGEVVVAELESSSEKDLALAVVAAVDAPLERVYEFVSADELAEISTVTLSRGQIDTSTFSLADMTLEDEVLQRLAEDPGDTFFMSEQEAARVAQAGKQGQAEALAAYQDVLSARARAYWEGGATAITPYAGKNRSPKVDLAHANEAARRLVRNPAILAQLDVIPSQAKGPAEHRLIWAIQAGRGQAAPVLGHRILYRQDDGEVFIERRFYSGYDYDALQILTGVLPAASGERCAVFYTNHTYTAQVAGFGGGAKRSIGRKLMQKELVAEMERAQQALAQN